MLFLALISFFLLRTVFSGAFSDVVVARKIATDELFAIKCIKRKALNGKEEALQNEISILRKYETILFS